LAIGFAQFILFEIVWGALINVLFIFGLDVNPIEDGFPDYNYILQTIPPSNATERILNLALETFVGGARVDPGPDVFYATPWLGVLVLALWCLLPLALGYVRFSTADL